MPKLIAKSTVIEPVGNKPKLIEEFVGGQAVRVEAGEWVRYSTPHPDGAEYIAVCLPVFNPATVHRDSD